uniref:Uncharacterized protein n=1 Tax=Nothobranchius furzeri TaxID=105023 RepID=A0A8C6LCH2_NOTFU
MLLVAEMGESEGESCFSCLVWLSVPGKWTFFGTRMLECIFHLFS